MKRMVACLLALVLLVCAALPALAAKEGLSLAKPEKLTVSTGGKAKQLVLRWSAVPGAEAYQVFRSTTGKSGTYKIVCGLDDTTYTDTGLKHATSYYYAVRALALNGEKTIYGPYRKANLSTRITKSYASGRFTQVYKAMHKFKNAINKNDAAVGGKAIEAVRQGWYGFYFPFCLKGVSTKADAVSYLSKYLEKKLAKGIVNFYLKTIKGKLYIWMPQDPGEWESLVINDVPTLKISYGDKKVNCKFGTWWVGFEEEMQYVPVKLSMVYQNGRWVFAEDNYWYGFTFPYTTVITPNDGP